MKTSITQNSRITRSFLFNVTLFLVISYFVVIFNWIFKTPLLIGFVSAILSFPIYDNLEFLFSRYLNSFSKPLAGVVTILLLSMTFVVLLSIFWNELQKEIPDFQVGITNFARELPDNESVKTVLGLDEEQSQNLGKEINGFIDSIESTLGDRQQLLKEIFSGENLDRTLEVGQRTFAGVFNLLLELVIFFLAWYYALLHGGKWIKSTFNLLPFNKKEQNMIRQDLKNGIRNVIYANLLSGFIHSLAGFAIMLAFGIENKFLITTFIFLIGVLPLSPSEVGYFVPIAILFNSNPVAAIVLIPIAEAIVLWVNYFLIPRVIADSGSGNPLLILTSILSGILIFGLMGFIIGPVIMILVQTLYNILIWRLKNQD